MSKKQGKELNIFERCAVEIIWALCYLIGHLPHFVLYNIIAPVVYFILYRMVGYRRRVVMENLERSFPRRSEEEREEIARKFYVVMSEILVGMLALANRKAGDSIFPTMEEESDDPDRATRLRVLTKDQSWIALTAHFGMWEYLCWWTQFADQWLFAVYHVLKNRIFEKLFQRLRSNYKVIPIPAKEVLRATIKTGPRYNGEPYVLGLIADQSPRLTPKKEWFDFLGRDTVFYDGGEKMALRLKMPTYFVYQRRRARGRYEFCFREIWDGKESVEPNEITSRYVKMLEEKIIDNPEMWLWSHRRWKSSRDSHKDKAWSSVRE
ncbi:MAG: lysophospholipid acyltransferase family protein [Rikenellaceae bacterium]